MPGLHLSRPRRLIVAIGAASALGGCAERRLVSAPSSPTTTGTWVAVAIAGLLITAVVAVLLNRAWWERPRGARLATVVLSLEAAAVMVMSVLLIAVAVRSWQLIDRPPDEELATSILRLSRLDGDGRFFALMVLFVVIVGGLAAAVLTLAARFAGDDDPLERWVACGVIGLQLAAGSAAAGCVALGYRSWPFLGPALAVPVLIAAFVSCWPRAPEQALTRGSAPGRLGG